MLAELGVTDWGVFARHSRRCSGRMDRGRLARDRCGCAAMLALSLLAIFAAVGGSHGLF